MNNVIGGHLMVFKGDDGVVDAPTLVEFTDFKKTGVVEIAFDDRGERIYVQFPLPELLSMIARENGSKE
jgi:hypothetical protein